jgi:glycosyltransferase involved in cell wall biosynthesis
MNKTTILLCGPPMSAVGGGPTHIRNMLASPLKDRYRLIHFETGSRGTESPARDEGLLVKIFRIVTSPFALAFQIMRTWPEVVHLNSGIDHKAFWRDFVYLLVSKTFGRHVVIQFHGGSLDQLGSNKWMRWVVRTVFSMSDALVILATSERAEFEEFGITKRVTVIPNGVDVSEFRGPADRVHSGKVRRLVYLGRLLADKGIIEAIQAVEILRTEEPFRDVELRIAGSGPAREQIEKYIQNRGLGNRVKLVGTVSGDAKVEFLRQADVFVFPTCHKERLPYSILESLAAGTPVIASKVAGIPDVVVDRVHGILIKPGDIGEVVSALRELGRSEDSLRAVSRNCIEWASQKLGLDRLAAQFEELYESVRA